MRGYITEDISVVLDRFGYRIDDEEGRLFRGEGPVGVPDAQAALARGGIPEGDAIQFLGRLGALPAPRETRSPLVIRNLPQSAVPRSADSDPVSSLKRQFSKFSSHRLSPLILEVLGSFETIGIDPESQTGLGEILEAMSSPEKTAERDNIEGGNHQTKILRRLVLLNDLGLLTRRSEIVCYNAEYNELIESHRIRGAEHLADEIAGDIERLPVVLREVALRRLIQASDHPHWEVTIPTFRTE